MEISQFHDVIKSPQNVRSPVSIKPESPVTFTSFLQQSFDEKGGAAHSTPQETGVSMPQMHPPVFPGMTDWEIYRDEQLLSNPGGDQYFIDQASKGEAEESTSFLERVGKDVRDAFSNLGNFFGHLLFGTETHYRDVEGQVQTAEDRGLIGSLVDFVKDIGSALTVGAWRPDGEAEPASFGERAEFVFSKLKEAFSGDLVGGVGGCVNHMAEDLVLAGWNLVEVIPDATIGNFVVGEKLTTNIFDNGQVAVDYLTDILPAGEAWLRVHSENLGDGELPVLFNLGMPETMQGDVHWETIRNTPFRKTIETIGALLVDVATLTLLDQVEPGSDDRRK